MNTQNKNTESKLSNRNTYTTSNSHEGQRKWILYQIGAKDPLLGFVHAPSKVEALDRVAGFKLRVIAVEANAPAEAMTPERIARHFKVFGSVIPASTADENRKKTAYFFRKEAISWARFARKWSTRDFAAASCNLAKSYLAIYRRMKGQAA